MAVEAARGIQLDDRGRAVRLDLRAVLRAIARWLTGRRAGAAAATRAATTSPARAVARSRRCSTPCSGCGAILVAAGERRLGQAGSPRAPRRGDGGAAALVGRRRRRAPARLCEPLARSRRRLRLARASRALCLRGALRARDLGRRRSSRRQSRRPSPTRAWRRRDIQHAAVHEPVAGLWREIRAPPGSPRPITPRGCSATRRSRRGARPVRLRAGDRARAKPGDRILLAGFGGGCDALVFELTAPMPGARSGRSGAGARAASSTTTCAFSA